MEGPTAAVAAEIAVIGSSGKQHYFESIHNIVLMLFGEEVGHIHIERHHILIL